MTPTREQVASWWLQANVYAELQSSDRLEQIEIANERVCTLAMSAGREQGLREAKEVCEAKHANGNRSTRTQTTAPPPSSN